MILRPENLLLYIILLTFSSVTHLSALRKGWHVAYFTDGMLCVLGSLLMCCNSLHSHYRTIRALSLGLYMAIWRVLHGLLLLLTLSCTIRQTLGSNYRKRYLPSNLYTVSWWNIFQRYNSPIHQSTIKHHLYFWFYWFCLLSSGAWTFYLSLHTVFS